jgi:hypothetical protein
MAKRNLTHAVLAIDPGGTTGVGAGYVDLKGTRRETLENIRNRKAVEVEGDWLSQSAQLAQIMNRFVFTANVEYSIPLPNIHICIEDFILRRRTQGGATGNLTSCWVAAGAVAIFQTSIGLEVVEGVMPVTWQQPSHAKTLMTDARLKSYGLWEVGSAHKRDVWRHFGLRVDKLIEESGI